MRNRVKQLPRSVVILSAFLLVALIGCVDYLTGDYSLLIFYAVPIALAGWRLGRGHALLLALTAGGARLVSDYCSYAATRFRYWNSLQDMVFLILVGFLVSAVKTLLSDERRRAG